MALYWLKLYKPLIDRPDSMQQSSNSGKGLGFIKPMGWGRLADVANNDFYIGACYLEANIAQAVHQTLKDISRTIKEMPARYITLPGSDQTVFEVEIKRISAPQNGVILDSEYFQSFGTMSVPKQIWDSFTRYSVWIEPALVNEWASLMAGYMLNSQQAFRQQAWSANQNEFFTQAAFALPGIQKGQRNFDDVFEAMTLQRDRIKDLQQLADWQ